MKFTLLTLGCKVNQAESTSLESDLIKWGHKIVPLSKATDVCIINTCTVTAKSDYQSRQYIRRALKTGARVYATGCYTQLNREEARGISEEIKIIKNTNKKLFINEFKNINTSISLINKISRSRAFIKIQDGCNYRCAYCAIPAARGRSRSIKKAIIIDEIRKAHDSGLNEVVLTGIHIGLYGHDIGKRYSLTALIDDILRETEISRVRISSLESNEIDHNLLELMKAKRICDHLHIPLQAGDDTILKAMGRNYRTADYMENLLKIKEKCPDICIGTDVICGFPGESDESFIRTKEFIDHCNLSYMHVFPYSERKNTKAASMSDRVRPEVRQERAKILRIMSERKKKEYMKGCIGSTLDVIVEKEQDIDLISATSGNYQKVLLKKDGLVPGSLIHAMIVGIDDNNLLGIPTRGGTPK